MIRVGYQNADSFRSNLPQQLFSSQTSNILEMSSAFDRVSMIMEPLRTPETRGPVSTITMTANEEFSVNTPAHQLFHVTPTLFRCDAASFYQACNVFIGYGSNTATSIYSNTRLNVNGGLEVKGDLYTTGITQFRGLSAGELICRPEAGSNSVSFKVLNSNNGVLFTISETGAVGIGRTTPLDRLHVAGTMRVESTLRAPRIEHPAAELLNIQMDPVANTVTGTCSINALTTRVTGKLEVLSDLKVSGNLEFPSVAGIEANLLTTNTRLVVNNAASTPMSNSALLGLRTRTSNTIMTVDQENSNLIHWTSRGHLGMGLGSLATPVEAVLHMRSVQTPFWKTDLIGSTSPLGVNILTKDGYFGLGTSNPIAPIHIHMGSLVSAANAPDLPSFASNPTLFLNHLTNRPYMVFASNTVPRAFFDGQGALVLGGLTANEGYSLRSDNAYIQNIRVSSLQSGIGTGGVIDINGASFANMGSTFFTNNMYLTADQSVAFRGAGSNMILSGHMVITPAATTEEPCVALAIQSGTRPAALRVSGSNPSIEVQRGSNLLSLKITQSNLAQVFFGGDTLPRLNLGTPQDRNGSLLQQIHVRNHRVYYTIPNSNTADVSSIALLNSSNALEKVAQLQGYSYQDNTEPTYGLFGIPTESALPETIWTDPVSNTKTIDYPAIIALLVESVKQLRQEVMTLKAL